MAVRFCADFTKCARAVATALALLSVGATARVMAGAASPDDARRREARREEGETRLRKVHQDIDELKQRLAQNETVAGSVLDAIEELDLRMALLRRESQSLKEEVRDTSEREKAARREAETLTTRLQETETALRAYLRETYKIGPARYLRVVTAASSPAQVAAGYRAIEAMSLGEADRIATFRADRERLDVALIDLRSQGDRLVGLQSELDGKARELRGVRERKGEILAGLQREEASQKVLLAEMVQVESEVRALLDRLARPGAVEPVPSLGFARYRGRLEWPARGRLAVPFGNVRHPRFSTEVPHPGVDIAASPGQDVRAVFDGRVVFSDWFKGYGQMVVIDHGDSYLSIYGHVDERLVSAGEDVSRGDVIGRSGQSGSFDLPGLYFEIRHAGKPEDPARWLRGTPGALAESRRPAARESRETRHAP
jgi:septal ring factor EnvC (AmiA/AmiB activator)